MAADRVAGEVRSEAAVPSGAMPGSAVVAPLDPAPVLGLAVAAPSVRAPVQGLAAVAPSVRAPVQGLA
ncbi:MAG: hypothetical protein WBF15_05765, partial [Candidatus Sulfotelmatobacter sp.]